MSNINDDRQVRTFFFLRRRRKWFPARKREVDLEPKPSINFSSHCWRSCGAVCATNVNISSFFGGERSLSRQNERARPMMIIWIPAERLRRCYPTVARCCSKREKNRNCQMNAGGNRRRRRRGSQVYQPFLYFYRLNGQCNDADSSKNIHSKQVQHPRRTRKNLSLLLTEREEDMWGRKNFIIEKTAKRHSFFGWCCCSARLWECVRHFGNIFSRYGGEVHAALV